MKATRKENKQREMIKLCYKPTENGFSPAIKKFSMLLVIPKKKKKRLLLAKIVKTSLFQTHL